MHYLTPEYIIASILKSWQSNCLDSGTHRKLSELGLQRMSIHVYSVIHDNVEVVSISIAVFVDSKLPSSSRFLALEFYKDI